jgi:pimeloyl-ACP methyl ester carboxylesterase
VGKRASSASGAIRGRFDPGDSMRQPGNLFSRVWRSLTRPLFGMGNWSAPLPGLADDEETTARGPSLRQIAAAVLRRLLLAPILLVAVMAMLVYGSTHRWTTAVVNGDDGDPLTPANVGLYYRDVRIRAPDGVQLSGWHIPLWSATRLMRQPEEVLRRRHPGVVLTHGAWGDRSQMLHLVPALHDAGYELLLIDHRGCGESGGSMRLGLSEWKDIRAATSYLQKCGPVDSHRIGVVTTGTHNVAALRAAAFEPAIRALVIDRPFRDLSSFIDRRFDHMGLPGRSMGRLYEWSFSLATVSDLNEASAANWASQLSPRQAVLVTAWQKDPLVPSGEPLIVLQAAGGPQQLKVNPHQPTSISHPAAMPADIIQFFAEHLDKPDAKPPGD